MLHLQAFICSPNTFTPHLIRIKGASVFQRCESHGNRILYVLPQSKQNVVTVENNKLFMDGVTSTVYCVAVLYDWQPFDLRATGSHSEDKVNNSENWRRSNAWQLVKEQTEWRATNLSLLWCLNTTCVYDELLSSYVSCESCFSRLT